MISAKLYKSIDVWKVHEDNILIRYRCFEMLGEKKFCVQSADFFRLPIAEEQIHQLEKQAMELFLETLPDERSETFTSLEEAIEMHESDFVGFDEEE